MRSSRESRDLAKWLGKVVQDFIDNSPDNTLQNRENDKAWANPLLGFSRGDDPLYEDYKDMIGPFHWTPWEIFNKTFPHIPVGPDQLTVMSWVLPHVEQIKSDNQKEAVYPAERWARARIYGEQFNEKLRGHVVTTLQGAGFEAVAPMLSPLWKRETSQRYGFASTWSERHAAYASGLGTFGLCDGLITPKGKAVRFGSVVARIQVSPTARPYTDHHAYCLFFTYGLCGRCIARCPVGALTEAGHDKETCRNYIREAAADYVKSHYGFEGYGCGLCQTGVPCESKIPTAEDLS
jgi:epoxyqueuosine reductase